MFYRSGTDLEHYLCLFVCLLFLFFKRENVLQSNVLTFHVVLVNLSTSSLQMHCTRQSLGKRMNAHF